MNPSVILATLVATSAGLRLLLGTRHPASLIPLIVACAVWFGDVRGSLWQWAFLSLGAALVGLTTWLTIELVGRRRHLAGLG